MNRVFGEGDEVEVVTAIRVNEIVFFEPTGPRLVQMRALAVEEVEGYGGQAYRAGKGEEPGKHPADGFVMVWELSQGFHVQRKEGRPRANQAAKRNEMCSALTDV